jgi:hypothetical protein
MIYRILGSLLVIIILVLVAAVAEDATAPSKPVRSAPTTSSEDSDMKGMKIN